MPKKPTLRSAKARAWKACSEYIRRKSADADGYVECVTCGTKIHWRDAQAGHFVPKKRGNSVYFLVENIHCQCVACNMFEAGKLIEYTRFIEQTYGREKVDELLQEAKKVVRYRLKDYLDIEADFKRQIDELS